MVKNKLAHAEEAALLAASGWHLVGITMQKKVLKEGSPVLLGPKRMPWLR